MNKVISFESYKIDRTKYSFGVKNLLLHDEYGNQRLYFCIVLLELETKNLVAVTGLEKYVVDLSLAEVLSENTYRYAMSRVTDFLNYLLHNTNTNSINEVTVNEIRGFLIAARTDDSGNDIKSDSWKRIQKDVFVFLENYYKYHKDAVDFGYNGDDLRNIIIIKENTAKRTKKHIVTEYKALNVKAPRGSDHKRRKRVIMYGHLETMLYAAKMYDPMLYLAITLMAYAGLREGEVVNLSFADICEKRKLGVLEKITLDLTENDKFRTGKTHKGVIKKNREQDVYPDFLSNVDDAIEFHKDYLQAYGLLKEGKNPVFYNKYGKAMSVTTMTNRIRNLFNNYFLSILKRTSSNTGFEGETYAFIEAYEDEYPGAHMFRHWFTMYLITKKNLRPEEVRKWRGDSPNSDAYEEYMHLNYDLIEAYKSTAYSFQEGLIGDIYGGV